MGKFPLFLYEKEDKTDDLQSEIGNAVKPIAEKYGQELVEVNIASNSNGTIIRISVGSKKGPTIGDLTSITKEFRKLADAKGQEFIPFDYQLEIGSPGTERELKDYRDFFWNEGKMLKVIVIDGDSNTSVQGELIRAEKEGIVLLCVDQEKTILYKDIIKAKVKVKF